MVVRCKERWGGAVGGTGMRRIREDREGEERKRERKKEEGEKEG